MNGLATRADLSARNNSTQLIMIPLAKDTREAIGSYAERVENRSLLFQKMVLSKSVLHDIARFDDAQRFNVLRATFEGGEMLRDEADVARKDSNNQNKSPEKRETAAYKAKVAGALASINTDNPTLADSRIRAHHRFLIDLRKSFPDRAVTFAASLGGRLLINMAGGVMENAGLSLDRLYGHPFIPGSAVKGITRHHALWQIRQEEDPQKQIQLLRQALAIFGFSPPDLEANGDFLWAVNGAEEKLSSACQDFQTDTYKGTLAFLTAHPGDSQSLRIVAEVITPHHDNNPRPIFFPAVEAGGTFSFALIAQRTSHLEDLPPSSLLSRAQDWLTTALSQDGIGAKTGAGFGWFQPTDQTTETLHAHLSEEEDQRTKNRQIAADRAEETRLQNEQEALEQARFQSLSPEEKAETLIQGLSDPDFAEFAKKLATKTELDQRAFLSVLLSSDSKQKRKNWKKKKTALWDSLVTCASTLNITLN